MEKCSVLNHRLVPNSDDWLDEFEKCPSPRDGPAIVRLWYCPHNALRLNALGSRCQVSSVINNDSERASSHSFVCTALATTGVPDTRHPPHELGEKTLTRPVIQCINARLSANHIGMLCQFCSMPNARTPHLRFAFSSSFQRTSLP